MLCFFIYMIEVIYTIVCLLNKITINKKGSYGKKIYHCLGKWGQLQRWSSFTPTSKVRSDLSIPCHEARFYSWLGLCIFLCTSTNLTGSEVNDHVSLQLLSYEQPHGSNLRLQREQTSWSQVPTTGPPPRWLLGLYTWIID
jgi:hypothetical protein